MAKEEEMGTVNDGEETPQVEDSFVTVHFRAPGSAEIIGLDTRGVSLNQLALAAKELQGITDFERWWAAYSSRMAQMEEEVRQKMEEEMLRRSLMQGGGLKPN